MSIITRQKKALQQFTKEEQLFLSSLSSPVKIQNYLESIPFNHEENGETCRSARSVIATKKAHCMEGAFLAAAALEFHGKKPQIISLKVTDKDYDHIITLYKENGYWGAISKTNHAVLGFRDPVYKTLRELVLSYFHEYFLVTTGEKTLRGYSRPINLNRFGDIWKYSNENIFSVAIAIYDDYHHPLVPKKNEDLLRKATRLERTAADISKDGK